MPPTIPTSDIALQVKMEAKKGGKEPELTQRAMENIKNVLQACFQPSPDTSGPILHVDVLQCTQGSRCGRICCAELGMGWVVLEVSWRLTQLPSLTDNEGRRPNASNVGTPVALALPIFANLI
uniref:Uncharacterized protein n=1 Tax=Amphora coffeiformis TaxID=265554 RepID=A0A7S3LFD6_9STRA|mmetsp:Transcript_17544/g.33320  ORF Transcript_17544/g.33320 Transcript_17544/m.33320 type:complete len:123 (-) Transcript_17544:136-504(-)